LVQKQALHNRIVFVVTMAEWNLKNKSIIQTISMVSPKIRLVVNIELQVDIIPLIHSNMNQESCKMLYQADNFSTQLYYNFFEKNTHLKLWNEWMKEKYFFWMDQEVLHREITEMRKFTFAVNLLSILSTLSARDFCTKLWRQKFQTQNTAFVRNFGAKNVLSYKKRT